MAERILVVDDEESILLFLRRALEIAGYAVTAVSRGASALEAMAAPPALAIVDIRLPDCNGLELVARIKRIAPATEVILISGFATIETAIKAIEYGAFAYITKPLILKEIHQTVERALEKRRLLEENSRLLSELKDSNRQLEELNRTLEKRVRERTEELVASQDELRRRAQVLAGINEITNAVASSLELDKILRAVSREMKKMVAFDRASISLTWGSNEVNKVFAIEPAEEAGTEKGLPYPLAGTGIEWVVRHRKPLLRPSFAAAPGFEEDAFIRATGMRSGVVVPLVYRGRVIGTLNLGSRRESAYDGSHEEILQQVAGQLAIALSNADLYRQLKDHSENLEDKVAERTEALRASLRSLTEAQDRLVRSEKLAAVAKLIAGVAHEIKNPLNSMSFSIANIARALAAVARPRDGRESREVCRESLEILRSDVARLKDLADRFIAFARPGQSRFEPAEVNPIVRAVVRSLSGDLAAKRAVLSESYGDDLPTVSLERDEFHQSVLNLLINALEAIPAGGRIAVATSLREGEVVTEVRDNGCGIPPEVGAKVFDVFFTTKPSGGGLGLSQVYRMAESHGGSATFESEPGKGTVFRIVLPLAPVRPPASDERQAE